MFVREREKNGFIIKSYLDKNDQAWEVVFHRNGGIIAMKAENSNRAYRLGAADVGQSDTYFGITSILFGVSNDDEIPCSLRDLTEQHLALEQTIII